ncbi:hypothetical protein ACFL5F_08125, partial [Planctomycetota bacterium]
MSRFYPTLPKALVVLFLLTCVCEYTTAESSRPYRYDPDMGMEEENIFKHFDLHRGRYWNYYARGSMFLAWDHYEAAEEDFRRALQKRPRDQRDARTYGMHFGDYFPNRELGVVYCLQGENKTYAAKSKKIELFKKAIDHLKISLNQEESSRAKFFLNRAMGGHWKTSGLDTTPPVVGISNSAIDRWEDPPTLYINTYEAILEIQAADYDSLVGTVWLDSFVGTEQVDRRKLFIESAERTFVKNTLVTVDTIDKEKTVVVTAINLAGKESQPAVVKLIVDTVPPLAVARVHPDMARLSLLGARIPVDIVAEDDQGLKSVRVGEDPYDNRDCHGQFRWEGRFFAEPGDSSLIVEVIDKAGNITTVKVTLESGQSLSVGRGDRMIGYNISPDHGQRSWESTFDVKQRKYNNIVSSLAQFRVLETGRFHPRLWHANFQRTASNEYRSLVPMVREFAYGTTVVAASHPGYLFQGQARHASRLSNTESIPSIILAPLANVYSPTESQPWFARQQKANKKSLPDRLWDPEFIYSIILVPVVHEYTERDPYEEYTYRNMANETELLELRNCREELHQRFDCSSFQGWDGKKIDEIDSKLEPRVRNELDSETKAILKAK